jgi:hypothetical protein
MVCGRYTHQHIAELARDLHDRRGSDVGQVVMELAKHAVAEVPGTDYASITVVTEHQHVETLAATHLYPVLLDKIEQRHLQGPCLVAAAEHRTIRVDNLSTETRWHAYQHDGLAETPIRSILSFELCTSRASMGSLNVFADKPNAFGADAEDIGTIYATHAALAWDTVRRDEQFRAALASRDILGHAKGMIMERFGVNAVRAFELLKKISQDSNTPVAQVAHNLVQIGHGNGTNADTSPKPG